MNNYTTLAFLPPKHIEIGSLELKASIRFQFQWNSIFWAKKQKNTQKSVMISTIFINSL